MGKCTLYYIYKH